MNNLELKMTNYLVILIMTKLDGNDQTILGNKVKDDIGLTIPDFQRYYPNSGNVFYF